MSVMQAKEFVLLNRELAILNAKILQKLDSISAEIAFNQFYEISSKSEEFLSEVIVELENKVEPEYINLEYIISVERSERS